MMKEKKYTHTRTYEYKPFKRRKKKKHGIITATDKQTNNNRDIKNKGDFKYAQGLLNIIAGNI